MYNITICDDQQDTLEELEHLILQEYKDVEVHCVNDLMRYGQDLESKQEELPDILKRMI